MFHYLDLIRSNDEVRRFTFTVEERSGGGWAKLRLVRIEDSQPLPGVPQVVTYDPAVHTPEGSHYMSHPWRARASGSSYNLIGAFGNPGSLMSLDETETILPLTG
jgi:hypothetical protein